MSRSRRKSPVCGLTTARSDKWWKQWAHRTVRHINNALLRWDHEARPYHQWELTNQYDTPKDGKHRFDPGKWPEGMRK